MEFAVGWGTRGGGIYMSTFWNWAVRLDVEGHAMGCVVGVLVLGWPNFFSCSAPRWS